MVLRTSVVTAFFCVMLITATGLAGPVVVNPGSTVEGKTIGQWTAEWWKWAGRVSPSVLNDPAGTSATKGQAGPVFFVAGTQGGTVNRSFQVPADKYILFPLLNWIVANGADPGFASTKDEAKALTDGTIDPSKIFASVDGIDVTNLASHRETAPANFTLNAIPDSFGIPAGTYTDANADGYWVMLRPLGAGGHRLHFGGTSNDFVGPDPLLTVPGFTVDTTASISAVPIPPALFTALPLLASAMAWSCLKARRVARV